MNRRESLSVSTFLTMVGAVISFAASEFGLLVGTGVSAVTFFSLVYLTSYDPDA